MRSARTVSNVIRITFGGLAAAANDGRTAKTHRFRMRMRRIKEKGACIVAGSLFGTKTRSRGSENELHTELHGPRAALGKERVAGRDVRRLGKLAERTARIRATGRQRVEVRVVQHIKDLPPELETQPLVYFRNFHEVCIPLDKVGPPEGVATASTDSAVGRFREYSRRVGNVVLGRITVVVGRGRVAIGPLVYSILASVISAAARQGRIGAPTGISGEVA